MDRFELLTLDNGVRIWHLKRTPRSLEPFFSIEINFGFGSRDLPDEELGLAHFLEHQIFNVRNLESWELRKLFRKNGGHLNASTNPDSINMEADILTAKSGNLLPLLVDMVREPILGRNLEREKDVVLREFDEKDISYEMCRRQDRALAECFAPFLARIKSRLTVLGTPETVAAYTEERLDHYWRNRLRKCLSSVIVVGEFSLPEISDQFSTLEHQETFLRPLYDGVWPSQGVRYHTFEGQEVINPQEKVASAVMLIPVDNWQHQHRLIMSIGSAICHEKNILQAREHEGLAYSGNFKWIKGLDHIFLHWTIPGDPDKLERIREIIEANILSLPTAEEFEKERETKLLDLLRQERNTGRLCSAASGDLTVIGQIPEVETVRQALEELTYKQFAEFWQTRIIEGRLMLCINRP